MNRRCCGNVYQIYFRIVRSLDETPVCIVMLVRLVCKCINGSYKGPSVNEYGNRTLSNVRRRYSQHENEALSSRRRIVGKRNVYLPGKRFKLITDSKPVRLMIFSPKRCLRIERWVIRLQTYDYENHTPALENQTLLTID